MKFVGPVIGCSFLAGYAYCLYNWFWQSLAVSAVIVYGQKAVTWMRRKGEV